MKFILNILITLFIIPTIAEDLIIDTRGYYTNEEIVMQNGNKLIQYQSKGNWSGYLNSYGSARCKGSLLIKKSGKRTDDELVLCELEDV